jgi:serine/threonine-protein kinase
MNPSLFPPDENDQATGLTKGTNVPDTSSPGMIDGAGSESTRTSFPVIVDGAEKSTINSPSLRGETGVFVPGVAGAADPAAVTAGFVRGYEILGTLGRGAMGIVFKARQPGLKRLVALKMILSGDHAQEQELIRFRGEAEAVARLQHPNIVQIYEIGEDAGRPFFSMEFVEGESLAKKIAGTPQPPREAARIVQILATAMQAAHQKNIIHRDLKPANVLMAVDGTPKITDFGLAKTLEEHTGQTYSGTILGTPSYMAPEQAEGRVEDIGPRSDVYSLGAVLYELLTGRAPFKAGSVLDTLEQVRTMEPVAPIQFAPSVPRDLETIALKCLQKDPARRYDTAIALAQDLGRFLAGEPILARPISSSERLWRWCRRNPRVALLSGLVVLAVLAWATTTSVLAIRIKDQKDKTEIARLDATQNAERAENNAAMANLNAAEAQKNAARAEKNALTAQRNHQLAVSRMLDLGEKLQKRLSVRRMGTGLEMRGVRDDLLKLLRETVLSLSKDLDGTDVTTFAMAAAHQQLGDLLVRIGLGEEALDQFRKAHKLVKEVVSAQPENDKARANLAVMLFRLGDAALDLQGDAEGALKYHQAAYDLLKEIADHPRSGDYTIVDNKRLLSHAALKLGKSNLARGDLAAANRCFEEALTFRQFWLEKNPKSSSVESYISEAYLWLGITAGREGKVAQATKDFEKCLELCESLATRHPKDISFKADLAEIYGYRGDIQLRFDQPDEAARSYQKSRENLLVVLNHDTEDTSHQSLTALTHERLAAIAAGSQKAEEATKRLQEALKIREEMLQIEPNNQPWRAAFALTLARAGKPNEASKIAEDVYRRCPNSAELLLQVARSHAICAKGEADTAKKRQFTEKSLKALHNLVAIGWKDARLLETDPDLAPVRNEAAFRELMGKFIKPSP